MVFDEKMAPPLRSNMASQLLEKLPELRKVQSKRAVKSLKINLGLLQWFEENGGKL